MVQTSLAVSGSSVDSTSHHQAKLRAGLYVQLRAKEDQKQDANSLWLLFQRNWISDILMFSCLIKSVARSVFSMIMMQSSSWTRSGAGGATHDMALMAVCSTACSPLIGQAARVHRRSIVDIWHHLLPTLLVPCVSMKSRALS